MRLAIPTVPTEELSSALLTHFDHIGAHLCLTPSPPPPFPVQPYLSRYPPYQRESIFVVALLALSPSVPAGPGPVELLNAFRAPFYVHLPHSVAMLVVRLPLTLRVHLAVSAVRG